MTIQYILTVSELTAKTRFLLETELNTVWLTGEISNLVQASSGHWYLSLKDERSQVRCAMFKQANRRVRLRPSNGQQVLVRAKVSLYEPRGDFQLIIEQMEDAGEGLLRQQFEQLKQRLFALGYFDQTKKQPLPKNIQTIGIVTSPTGAAVKDIISVLKRRNPLLNVIIYPSLVQGELAAQSIVQAIMLANERSECDVLIVGRGGGSMEDLWCFNDERVLKAIVASQLPIVSAVGHEIDTTLADFAADIRAATPSAAAELVATDMVQQLKYQQQLTLRLIQASKRLINDKHQQVKTLLHQLQQFHPLQQLRLQQQRADFAQVQLIQLSQQFLEHKKQQVIALVHRLQKHQPQQLLRLQQQQLSQLNHRLIANTQHLLERKQQLFKQQITSLHLVSPLATLSRGYAVVKNEENKIISQVTQLNNNERIKVQLVDGELEAIVTNTYSIQD
jgi:exodeoxyribonuclease VII large subunit